jgi:hypothetical protein
MHGSLTHIVRFAINFDHQLGGSAIEVDNASTDRVLKPEFEAVGSLPKHLPE